MSVPPASLASAFLAAAPPALREPLAALAGLEAQLGALLAEGRGAWPELAVAPEAFVALVGRHVGEASADALAGLRPTDLYLACGCAAGDRHALAAFERGYMREVDLALARMRVTGARLADVRQLVRQRLFVGAPARGGDGPGTPGKIVEYGGRGDLRRWVRAVAVRLCLNELRRGKREVLPDDDQLLANHAIAGDDPELDYMKRTYAAEFRAAFGEALAALPPREQTLLRYHHVDGLNIDEIGAIYRVHRVTAFRWLEKAKEQLAGATLAGLRRRLRVAPAELDSVLRLIRSQIHLSIVRHLGGPADRVENDELPLGEAELEAVEDVEDVEDVGEDVGADVAAAPPRPPGAEGPAAPAGPAGLAGPPPAVGRPAPPPAPVGPGGRPGGRR